MSFSLEYCSSRAFLFLRNILAFLLSSLHLIFSYHNHHHTSTGSRPPLSKAIKDSLQVLTYGEILDSRCHSHHHDQESEEEEEDTEGRVAGSSVATCAVCLNELKRKDKIRELRNCNHVFHRGCLDRWLDHDELGTCPLCRAPLLRDRGMEVPPGPPAEPSWVVDRLLYLFGDDLLVCTPSSL